MLLDIHTHILPQIDDGASSIGESRQLARLAKQNGIDAIIATPHYYHSNANFMEYDSKVCMALTQLRSEIPEIDIYKGYEVYFFKGISSSPLTPLLTLNGSKYILIELAYGQKITDIVLDEIKDIYHNLRLTPIFAHIERYKDYHGYKKVLSLLDEGFAMAHVNASSFEDRFCGFSLDLIKNGYVSIVATDMHSVDLRPPKMRSALMTIKHSLGEETIGKLAETNQRLYNDIILR